MRALLFVFAAATSVFATSCFKVDKPACSYACSDEGECPDDYVCAADGYCHRSDYSGECNFGSTDDLSLDMSILDSNTPD